MYNAKRILIKSGRFYFIIDHQLRGKPYSIYAFKIQLRHNDVQHFCDLWKGCHLEKVSPMTEQTL